MGSRMATRALKLVSNESPSDAGQSEAFARELSALSHKYGIGIAGSPSLFVLEQDDFALTYACDEESRLTLV